jgi:hypothetical protein
MAELAVLAIMLDEQRPLSKRAQVMTRNPQVAVNITVAPSGRSRSCQP